MFRGFLRRAVGCISRNYAAFGIISISITIDMVMIVRSGIDVESLWANFLPDHLLRVTWRIGSRHREGVHWAVCRRCSVERRLHEVDIWLIMRHIRRLRPAIKVRDLHFNIFCVRVHSLFSKLIEVLLSFELLL